MNIDLSLVYQAIQHYMKKGCFLAAAPYLVDPDIMAWTCPEGVIDKRFTHVDGKQYVASAEQSFLQMEKDGRIGINQPPMLALTPCYRDESVLDETHLNIFLKLEIFEYNPESVSGDYFWANEMRNFFWQQGLNTEVKPTDLGFDVLDRFGMELGSFGYRVTPKGVNYVYGTGLAEPRASLAIARDKDWRLHK